MSFEVASSACEKTNSLITRQPLHPVIRQPHQILLSAFNKLVVSSKELSDLLEVQCSCIIAVVEEMLEFQPRVEGYNRCKAFVYYNLYCLRDLYVGLLDQHRCFSRNTDVVVSKIEMFYCHLSVNAVGKLKEIFSLNIFKVQVNFNTLAEYLCKRSKPFELTFF